MTVLMTSDVPLLLVFLVFFQKFLNDAGTLGPLEDERKLILRGLSALFDFEVGVMQPNKEIRCDISCAQNKASFDLPPQSRPHDPPLPAGPIETRVILS